MPDPNNVLSGEDYDKLSEKDKALIMSDQHDQEVKLPPEAQERSVKRERQVSEESLEREEKEIMEKLADIYQTPFLVRRFRDNDLVSQKVKEMISDLEYYHYPELPGELNIGSESSEKTKGWYANLPIDCETLTYDPTVYYFNPEQYQLSHEEIASLGLSGKNSILLISNFLNPYEEKKYPGIRNIFLEELGKYPELITLFDNGNEAINAKLTDPNEVFNRVLEKMGISPSDRSAIADKVEEIAQIYGDLALKYKKLVNDVLVKSGIWLGSQKDVFSGQLKFPYPGYPQEPALLISSDSDWRVCERQTGDYGIEVIVKNQIKNSDIRGVLEPFKSFDSYDRYDRLSHQVVGMLESNVTDRKTFFNNIGLTEEVQQQFEDLLDKYQREKNDQNFGFGKETQSQMQDLIKSHLVSYFQNNLGMDLTKCSGREFAIRTAMLFKVPCYSRRGDLLWPKQMSYDEVKTFVAERNQKDTLEEPLETDIEQATEDQS